ncbi:TPA: tail fiber protein [Enterobacter hormaechei subsp. xiangfangensis]|nr:tail fiber protein [Enterobacter hormaechei subsp. xiangfangensis]HAV1890620.1 tail fiber protein [Enterobacter hormaechei subsp. xiangfangensis]
MAGNINEAAIFSRDANLPLMADVQYLEPYGSGALNRKMLGIILPGVFRGFDVKPGTGLNVVVTSTAYGSGAACIEVNGYQITVQQFNDVTIAIPKGQTTVIALEANYGQGQLTRQVSSTATLEAAKIVTMPVSQALKPNQIELARVTLSAAAINIVAANINMETRTRRRVGPIISDAIDSTEQYQVASSNAVRLALAKGLEEMQKRITRGDLGLDASGLTLVSNFDWQQYVFKGGEYLYIDWTTSKNRPALDYPNGYYQIMVIGLNDGTNQTLLMRPVNYTQPLAPFFISWTGARGSRVFRTRAVMTAFEDISLLSGITPNDLKLKCHVGHFSQPMTANAIVANGYPVAEAGVLKVVPSAYGVQQEYVTFSSGRRFTRGLQNQTKAWGLWIETLISTNLATNNYDSTPNKITRTGDGGLLGQGVIYTSANIADKNGLGSMILKMGGGTDSNRYGGFGVGLHMLYGPSGSGAETLSGNLFLDGNGILTTEWLSVNKTSGAETFKRGRVYSEVFKPTPDNVGAVARTGDTMAGQLKINITQGTGSILLHNAKGTLADEYGVWIYRSLINEFSISPTAKGGSTGNVNSNAAGFSIALDTGVVSLKKGAKVKGLFVGEENVVTGMGVNSIALGDNDSGLRWNIDGNYDLMANGRLALNINGNGGVSNIKFGFDITEGVTFTNGEVRLKGDGNLMRFFKSGDANDYGVVFHRAQDNFYIIPTAKGEADTNKIGNLRPLTIFLADGWIESAHGVRVGGGGLKINAGGLWVGSNPQNKISNGLGNNGISLGDSDTGLKWNSDGNFDVMANAATVLNINSGAITAKKPLTTDAKLDVNAGIEQNFTGASWIGARDNTNCIYNPTELQNAGAVPIVRLKVRYLQWMMGALASQEAKDQQIGFYGWLNSRTENGTDYYACLTQSGWRCSHNVYASGFTWGNWDTGAVDAQKNKIYAQNHTAADGNWFGAVWNRIAGASSSNNDGGWLSSAVQRAYDRAAAIFPQGAPIPWPTDSIPSGFTLMDGKAINKTTYPGLAALYGANLIDMRGQTIKGKPASGRAVRSYESDGIKTHTHTASSDDADLSKKTTSENGEHSHALVTTGSDDGHDQANSYPADGRNSKENTLTAGRAIVAAGKHTHTVEIGKHKHGITVNPTGNTENTVKNYAFNYIVKLF